MTPPPIRLLAWFGLIAVAVSAVMIGLLHVVRPSSSLDPMSRTISEYALLSNGWVFDVGVIVLAIGSVAVLQAMAWSGQLRWRSWSGGFAISWCVGLVGLVVFPKQGFGPDTTVLGRIHWSWTLLAFISLPIAAVILSRRQPGGWARWIKGLNLVAGGWFAVLAVQTVLSATHTAESSHFVGLVERGVSVTEMVMMVVFAGWVLSEIPVPQPLPAT